MKWRKYNGNAYKIEDGYLIGTAILTDGTLDKSWFFVEHKAFTDQELMDLIRTLNYKYGWRHPQDYKLVR